MPRRLVQHALARLHLSSPDQKFVWDDGIHGYATGHHDSVGVDYLAICVRVAPAVDHCLHPVMFVDAYCGIDWIYTLTSILRLASTWIGDFRSGYFSPSASGLFRRENMGWEDFKAASEAALQVLTANNYPLEGSCRCPL